MSDSQPESRSVDLVHEQTGLTAGQFLMWVSEESVPGVALFNELSVLVVEGAIDHQLFTAALQELVDSTDVLRTVVHRVDGLPRTEVLEHVTCSIALLDFSDEPDPLGALDRWAQLHVDSLIDISKQMLEVTLIKLADARYAWTNRQHHLVTDAQSMRVIFERLGAAYERLVAGTPNTASPPPPPQYAEYVEHERPLEGTAQYAKSEAFWDERTKTPPDPLTFYNGRSLSIDDGYHRVRAGRNFGIGRSEAFREFCNRKGIHFLSADLTRFSVIAAAYLVYLSRISGQRKIAIGVPWQNRRKKYTDTVGLIMQQNPLIVELDAADTFEDVIRKVQRDAVRVLRHMPYATGNPGGRVYSVGLNYMKATIGRFAGMPVTTSWFTPTNRLGGLDLNVHDFDESGDITMSFDFNDSLFEPEHREHAVNHFLNCLWAGIDDSTQLIGSVNLLTAEEHATFDQWNATEAEYPRDQTVADLFEAQVARKPDAIAASCDGSALSYAELNGRANVVAARLRALGVQPGVLVGVSLRRSLDMLVGLLGVMKTGGAYVPMDPTFPAQRVAFMLADSAASVLLTETTSLDVGASGKQDVVSLDSLDFDQTAETTTTRAAISGGADDLAYVLYTSGSTGQPKGVEISNGALINFLWSMKDKPKCTEDDVVLAVTTISFDIAGLELYLPLISGGQVEIATNEMAADGRLIRDRLDVGDITLMQATPSTWRMLIDADWAGSSGLKALIGGEALPPELVSPLLERTASLWNMYGPTETTIWSSVQQIVDADAEVTVGKPISNTTFHLLDGHEQHVPVGVAGELFIGGDSVANGYLGRPELTAERFLPDPYSAAPGATLYRTGDLARYRPDGQLVHLGRLDQQVKIRGFRVELGEIDLTLGLHDAVRQTAVVAGEDARGSTALVAYCVAVNQDTPTADELRRHLSETLPDYMVPHRFVWLDEMPLTPNGKIDRNQLPSPDSATEATTMFLAPRTEVEATVAAIFASLLQLDRVGYDADLFELGGDSLLAVQLFSEIEVSLKAPLQLRVLFDGATVAAISDRVCDVTGAERAIRSGRDHREWTETERTLVDIWSKVLNTPVESIHDSFLDLQGPANLIPQMLGEVRESFGTFAEGLSALNFEAEPTIAGLERLLEARKVVPSHLVVPLQRQGTKTALFLIHAAGGYVFFYRALAARLAPDRPVYGLRSVTPDDDLGRPFERSKSVERLAAQYITEIKTIQSEGPYHLGGASFGGVVAFEIARQLVANGERIASPILMFDAFIADPRDSMPIEGVESINGAELVLLAGHVQADEVFAPPPGIRNQLRRALARPSTAAASLLGALRWSKWRVGMFGPMQQFRWTIQRARSKSVTPDIARQQSTERGLEATYRLLMGYHPTPYSGGAAIFRANVDLDPVPGWNSLITGGIEIHDIPGSHLDMLEEPAVEETAALVARHLDAESSTPRQR